jgi:hypothetical protein
MITTAILVAAAVGLGGVAGLFGGLFGVGGGFLVIPLLGFFYGMDQQTRAGYRPDNGGAERPLSIFAISATLRHRSADGGDHRRVSLDCNLSDSAFGDRPRPARLAACFRCFSRDDRCNRRLPHMARCWQG